MLTRNDVEEALHYMDQNNLIRLHKQVNGWYMIHCPFHSNGQERRPSCECSLEETMNNGKHTPPGFFFCFACHASYDFGTGIKKILEYKGTSLAAHPKLEKYVDGSVNSSDEYSLISSNTMQSLMAKFAVEDLRTRSLLKKEYVSEEELAKYRFTVPYMYQRKLTDAIIEKYDVGFDANYIPEGRKNPVPCVTFPVKDTLGNTLFICRRSIQGKFFFMPTGIEKSVYGLYELPKNCKEVIICESIFNALTCVAYGHPAVALLGTGTPKEAEQLKRLGVSSFVLSLDNDDAGRRGTERLKKALERVSITSVMTVPDDGTGKDINDLSYEEFNECYLNRE